MKCYLHVSYDPEPKPAENPYEAIELAEKYLIAEKKDLKEDLNVKWRRDDLYPDNFLDYDSQQLVQHLSSTGQLVLQLAKKTMDGLPIMGESVSIFTDVAENKNNQEAEEALQRSESHTYKIPISLTSQRRKT